MTINYRLGFLGFFAHPDLTKEGGGTSGNYALYDMRKLPVGKREYCRLRRRPGADHRRRSVRRCGRDPVPCTLPR